jgi:hypothetical protein
MAQIWEGENKIEKLSVVQADSKKSGCDKKNLELKKGGLRLFIWFDFFRSTEYTRGPFVFRDMYIVWQQNCCSLEVRYSI